MADIRIADRTIDVLQKTLDLRQQKQQMIAANIANAETPGYSPRKLSFEEDLQKAIASPATEGRRTNSKHFPIGNSGIDGVRGKIIKDVSRSPIGDNNNVSIDDEMLDLAENQLLYETSAQMLKKKLTMLKYAVANGR